MATLALMIKIDGEHVLQGLQEAQQKLDNADGELVLDFSAVQRIEPAALREMEILAHAADAKKVKVSLRGTAVHVYKVLKLARLTARFTFLN